MHNADPTAPVPSGKPDFCMRFVPGMCHSDRCWSDFEEFFKERGIDARAIPLQGDLEKSKTRRLRFTPLGDYAKVVVQAVLQCDQPVVLVGHSMGALVIARAVTLVRPAAIVLLAPASTWSFRWANIKFAIFHPWLNFKSFFLLSPRRAFPTPEIFNEQFCSYRIPEDNAVLQRHFACVQEESFLACAQMLAGWVLHCPRYRRLGDIPVLVLGAKNDRSVARCCVKWVACRLGVQATIVRDIAHDMMLDRGWERVATKVFDWLKRQPKLGFSNGPKPPM